MVAESSLLAILFLLASTNSSSGSRTAEDKEWVVVARAVGQARRNSPTQAEIEVKSRSDFHLNDDYPLNFKPKASPATTFALTRIERKDGMRFEACATDREHNCGVRIPVSFTPRQGGMVPVSGTLAFSVCNADRCLIKKVELTLPVQVEQS